MEKEDDMIIFLRVPGVNAWAREKKLNDRYF